VHTALSFAVSVTFGLATAAGCGQGGAVGGSGSGGGGVSATGGRGSGGRGSGGGSGGRGSGGSSASGGGSGGAGSGGAGGAGSGGAGRGGAGATGSGGAGGSGAACKRGIAANSAPGAAFFPAIGWWYDWAIAAQGRAAGAGIEFVPMVWGSATVNAALPVGAKYLLTFNEPNFHAQSNLTAAQAAGYWPTLQDKARAAGIPIVSPGMNFCGPAASCNGTDPYQYLEDFFAACAGCQVDYVAVHWYNCDLPSLRDYLEPGGNLEGFEQYGKPIWITELSCDPSASAASQEAYMRAAIPYLEGNPRVYRYSWFSADPIPNARLVNADGSPTALGQIYIDLPGGCR